MSLVNANAIETIPEDTLAEDQHATPDHSPTMITSNQGETEGDKYENVTDPVILRKARAVAKANHTRSTRAVHETSLAECPIETLEKLHTQLTRNFDIVNKRHIRLLSCMPQPDESELEDEHVWIQRIQLDHQTTLDNIEIALAARQTFSKSLSPRENVQVAALVHQSAVGDALPITVPQTHVTPPDSRPAPSQTFRQSVNRHATSSTNITPPPTSVADSQASSFQGFFRQVRGFATRTWDAITPRRGPQPLRTGLFVPPLSYQTTRQPQSLPTLASQFGVQRLESQVHPPLRRRLEDSMNRSTMANAVTAVPQPRAVQDVQRIAQPAVHATSEATQLASQPAPLTQPLSTPSQYDPNANAVGRVSTSYSPDSWIFDPDANLGSSFLKPPKLQLMKFDGHPLNWPLFIQTFKVQVHDAVKSDAERIAHLGCCLPDHIRAQLGQLIIQPGLYRYALAELQRLYGSRQVIIKSCTAVLEGIKPFNNNDHQGLSKLSSSLRSVVASMQLCGFDAELRSYSNVELILRKLSPKLQDRWATAVWSQPELPSLVDLSEFIFEISMIEYTRRLGFPSSNDRPAQFTGRQGKPSNQQGRHSGVGSFAVSVTVVCDVCKSNHALSECQRFKSMSVERRCEVVRDKNLCLRCLAPGHRGSDCSVARKCGREGCERLHHQLLHDAPRIFPSKLAASGGINPATTSHFAGAVSKSHNHGTMLPIVPVRLESNGRVINTFAFLDQGSELTLLSADIAKDLFLDGPATSMTVETVNGRAQQEFRKLPSFIIASRDGRSRFELVETYAIERLQIAIKRITAQQTRDAWPHLKGIEFASPESNQIGILVGADQPAVLEILEYRKDPVNPRAPRGLLTHFGWCVAGPSSTVGARSSGCYHTRFLDLPEDDDPFTKGLRKFVGIDEFGMDARSKTPVPPSVIRATQTFEQTIRLVDGHYEVGLPWADNEPLPNNRDAAMRWFVSQETRLLRNPALAQKVRSTMQENVDLGFARKLTQAEDGAGTYGRVWYNKYHSVVNPNKPEKCRVVFDLSALFSGVSLNSKLLKGPDFIASQVGVTLRFRRHRYAIVADIEKMFYQVLVRSEDASAFRYLWREPGSREPPATYQMKVHLFGATSSPAVCCFALLQAAKDSGEHAEELVDEVVNNFYVDNWLNSFDKKEAGIRMATLLINALKRAGFNLTQFAASHREILEAIKKSPGGNHDFDMSLDEEGNERTLGLLWNYRRDTFKLSVKQNIPARVTTKRELLSVSSKIYDPLGFLASVKLTPKLLFQETCRQSLKWDDPLPDKLVDGWERWTKSLPALRKLEIPRCLRPPAIIDGPMELHVFSDASEYAHGAVGFIRYLSTDHATCSMVMAKSNLAPIKPTTIPRNELNGALSAARLSRTLVEELKMDFARVVYWTDSTTVLRWVRIPKVRFTAYVGARIGEILELTMPYQWHYVPTGQNPADDASRGIPPEHLNVEHRWFRGPDFLALVPDQWPNAPFDVAENVDDPEIRPSIEIFSTVVVAERLSSLIDAVSMIPRLLRATAYVLRWVYSAKERPRVHGEITVQELQDARKFLLRHQQLLAFRKDIDCLRAGRPLPIDSSLSSLRPFLDEDGLLRVGGRFSKSDLPLNIRRPILLPHKSRLTRLIVEDVHRPLGCLKDHLTKQETLNEVRRLYWIPRGRQTVGKIVHDCLRCKIKRRATVTPVMADLPTGRLQHGLPAFTHTGVDYFGPFEVVIFRRKVKRWLVLFVCPTTRAVHLDVVFSMSTDSFLACLWRFEARRGVPSHYYSDNGTYFVGAVNELAECLRHLDQAKIANSLARRGVTWRFNPPGAPHFGGVWERLVGSAKRAFGSVLSGQSLTDEVLFTATAQVESFLNSRPLTYLCDDPAEPEPLTPNHLLLGRASPNLPPDVFTGADLSAKKYWRRAQAIATHFWRRWMREYLPPLNVRSKWTSDQRNLRKDDVVALLDSDQPRGTWKLARVIEVFPGADGIVRSVDVKIATVKDVQGQSVTASTLHRPVHKMVLLLPADEHMCPQAGPGPAVLAN